VAWSPWWLSESGIGLLPFQLPFAAIAAINQVGLFAGPFAAAFLVTRVCEGRQGVRRLQLSMVQWRVRPAFGQARADVGDPALRTSLISRGARHSNTWVDQRSTGYASRAQ